MHSSRTVVCAVLLVLVGAASASAQNTRKTGIVMGYPAAVGLMIPMGENVAIRPELTLTATHSKSSGSSFTFDSDSWTIGTGVSVLFYTSTHDRLRTYFSPHFSYQHVSSESEASGVTNSSTESNGNAYGGSGSFGAQYDVADRFSVFGEVGFGFSRLSTKSDNSPTKVTSTGWGTRSAVGVIFFF